MPDAVESRSITEARPILQLGSVPRIASVLAVVALLPLGGCNVLDHGMLGAAGPVADQTRHLFFIVCGILLFVVGPVLLLTPLFAWREFYAKIV